MGVVTQEVADDMTVGTYQARSAYELKPRKGINKYTPEEFTQRGQRGKRTVDTSRMAALYDYLDDYVDDVEEPEPERVPLPRKVKKISVKRGGEEPSSAESTSHRPLLNLEWNLLCR